MKNKKTNNKIQNINIEKQQITIKKIKHTKKTKTSEDKKSNYFFIALYALALITLILLFRPFLTTLIFGGIITIFFFPINRYLRKILKPSAASAILTISILLLILIPTIFLGSTLVKESLNIYNSAKTLDLEQFSGSINLGLYEIDSKDAVLSITRYVNSIFSVSINKIVGSLTELFIKFFILIFFLIYAFKDGDKIVKKLFEMIPVSETHKEQIMAESQKVLFGVMYGQFLMALLQGLLGGFAFFIFGFSNPVFWGFIMAVLAFIPIVGTPLVWIPFGILAIMNGNLFSGIGLLAYGVIIIFTVENIVKPRVIGEKTGLHPVIVLLSIFGGVYLLGAIGFLFGPILAAICLLIIKFFNRDVTFH